MPTLAPSLAGLHPINLLHSHACQLPPLWPGCCILPSWRQLHFSFFSSSRIFFCQIPLSFPPGNIYLCVKELVHAKQPKSGHILWKVKHIEEQVMVFCALTKILCGLNLEDSHEKCFECMTILQGNMFFISCCYLIFPL